MTWWKFPDWALAQLVTQDEPDAIEEFRRRIALKEGDCLCDEILAPAKYARFPFGPDPREAEIRQLQDEIEEFRDEIASNERQIDRLRREMREKA